MDTRRGPLPISLRPAPVPLSRAATAADGGPRVLGWLAGLIESSYVVVGFMLFSGAFTAIPVKLAEGALTPGETNPWNTMAMMGLLAGSALLCHIHRRDVGRLLLQGWLVNAFVLLAVASALWSVDAEVTLRRSVTLLASVLFAYFVAARFDLDRIIRLLALATLITALASVAISLGLPRVGVATPSHPGAWNGVFAHKNSLGWMMILMAICWQWLWLNDPARRVRAALALAVCLGVTAMTQSMTAVVTIGIVALLRMGLTVGRVSPLPRAWLLYGMTALVVGGSLGMVTFWTEIMTGLNRDPTLTGRVPLWAELIAHILDNPLLGAGYSAFWLEWNPDVQALWQVVGWQPPDGHNGYLDLAVQLGIGGALLGAAPMLVSIGRSVSAHLDRSLPGADFVFVYSTSLLISNLDETMLYRSGDIHCALMVICYLCLQKWSCGAEQPSRPPHVWRPRPAER